MEGFVKSVQQDCAIEQKYFWFSSIPELIIKKEYTRKDYEDILLKILKKVQGLFLKKKKAKILEDSKDGKPDINLDDVVITDEDLVPLDLFDRVVEELENKARDRNNTIRRFIKSCQ